MKVAMVKHKPYGKVFWFEIPEHLVGKLQPGFRVACNTARGRRYGTVVAADLDEQDVKEVMLDSGYLLDKLASPCVINEEATFEAVKELMEAWDVDFSETDRWGNPVFDMDEIKDCCYQSNERDVHDALERKFEGTSMETCDDYDLWGCIQKDFTTNAKKIVQVFMDHIRPMCKKLSLSDVQIAEADKDGRLVALPSDKALTNADRMRAATNQQLAKLLYDNQKEFCRLMYKNLGFEDELTFSEDYSDILAWLNAPAEMGVVQDKDE